MKREGLWWKILLAIVLVLAVVVGAGVIWASDTNPVEQPALDALVSGDDMMVTTGDWIVFEPQTATPDTGLIFYPGGRVDARAYAAHVRGIAEQAQALAVIVPMPLNLAVLGIDSALEVQAAYPQIDTWFIGGHSLGAVMSASFVYNNPGAVDGLLLWAGYPARSTSLADRDLPVQLLFGEFDERATPGNVDTYKPYLPPDTQYVMVQGGNHAGFGWYGAQSRDGERTISHADQQAFVVEQSAAFIETVAGQ